MAASRSLRVISHLGSHPLGGVPFGSRTRGLTWTLGLDSWPDDSLGITGERFKNGGGNETPPISPDAIQGFRAECARRVAISFRHGT